jgi:threonine synthase
VAVQAEGCAPIVRAFKAGERHATPWQDAHTIAAGIRVPAALGDFLILDALRDSGGFATAVSDDAITDMQHRIAREEGMLLCPEGAATAAALVQEVSTGRIGREDQVVLFNCATGLKYPMPAVNQHLDISNPVDFSQLRR